MLKFPNDKITFLKSQWSFDRIQKNLTSVTSNYFWKIIESVLNLSNDSLQASLNSNYRDKKLHNPKSLS